MSAQTNNNECLWNEVSYSSGCRMVDWEVLWRDVNMYWIEYRFEKLTTAFRVARDGLAFHSSLNLLENIPASHCLLH